MEIYRDPQKFIEFIYRFLWKENFKSIEIYKNPKKIIEIYKTLYTGIEYYMEK